MKLLFILENYLPHFGGVEVVFKNVCEGFAKRGHRVDVVTHQLKHTKREEVLNGVNIHRVPCFHSRYWFTFLAPLKALKFAKEADVIHTTTFNAAPVAWLVAKLVRKPVVLTVHETWIGKWDERTTFPLWKVLMHEFLERCIFLLRYDRYVCVSNATAQDVKRVLPKKFHKRIVVNHNGVQTSFWSKKVPLNEIRRLRRRLNLGGKFVVLGYGRPGPSKGFEYFVEAMPEILKKIPSAHFVLIWPKDDQYVKCYERLVRKLKKTIPSSNYTLLPPQKREDLPVFLQMADCIVIPSIGEGFGYTTVESNATGTPVVATKVGSIPEVVSGKYVLVEPRSAQEIAKGVEKVSNKQYVVTKLRNFSWNDNLQKLEELYGEIKK